MSAYDLDATGPPNGEGRALVPASEPYSPSPATATAKKQKPAQLHSTIRSRQTGARTPGLHRWPCRCEMCTHPPIPITHHQLDGAVAAARHLLGLGLPPLFAPEVIDALGNRPADWPLAQRLYGLAGGEA